MKECHVYFLSFIVGAIYWLSFRLLVNPTMKLGGWFFMVLLSSLDNTETLCNLFVGEIDPSSPTCVNTP